jgi:hypothetical protein
VKNLVRKVVLIALAVATAGTLSAYLSNITTGSSTQGVGQGAARTSPAGKPSTVPTPQTSNTSVPEPGSFTITGDVPVLFPGATAELTLTVQNRNYQAITVSRLTVASTGVDAQHTGCDPLVVSSPGFSGSLSVASMSTATTDVPISMSASAPDACQGATFTLTYGGSAT